MHFNLRHLRNAVQIMRMITPLTDVPAYLKYRRSAPAHWPQRAFHVRKVPGVAFYCRPATTDALVLQDTFAGEYHRPPTKLSANPVILDLGANVGFVAAHYAHLYPAARIVSVELDEANAVQAKRNVESFGDQVSIVLAAIWKHDGTVSYGGDQEWGFHITPGAADNSTQPPGARQARAVTIDTLLREAGIERVDFLKMDIEGAEADVLEAGGNWPDKTSMISVEVHKPTTTGQVAQLLQGLGFRTRLDPHHWALVHGVR